VSIDPATFGWLVKIDPVAFLGDIDVPDPQLRAAVVAGLFDLAAAEEWQRDWGVNYHKLAHPGLLAQIRSHLADESVATVRLAMELAADCDVTEARPDLVAIAFDRERETYERYLAAVAVFRLSEKSPTDALLALVVDPTAVGGDPDDELFGAALLASWPHALGTAGALRHAREPKRRNLHGTYQVFLSRLADTLTKDDVPAALEWLEPHAARASRRLAPLVNAIVRLALDEIDDARTLQSLVGYARGRLADYQPLLMPGRGDGEHLLTTVESRGQILSTVLLGPPCGECRLSLQSVQLQSRRLPLEPAAVGGERFSSLGRDRAAPMGE
jgi:hypothetical protein